MEISRSPLRDSDKLQITHPAFVGTCAPRYMLPFGPVSVKYDHTKAPEYDTQTGCWGIGCADLSLKHGKSSAVSLGDWSRGPLYASK